jgi:uncharacterized short protein YbdD (DUF466 family)
MRRFVNDLRDVGTRCWRALRALTGDDAYERYLAHLSRRHPGQTPLSAATFYLREQERRWNNGPNRCC